MQERVFLRPVATPLPLGLFVFAVGMLLLGGQGLGFIATSEAQQVGVLCAAFVFPSELIAGVFAFLARDALAGTVLVFYAVSWIAIGISQVAFPPEPSDALGTYLVGFSVVIFALAPLAAAGKPLLCAVLTVSAVRALLQGLYELSGSTSLHHADGVAGLALAAVAFYAGVAFVLEDVLGRPLLPTFRRGAAAAAVEGGEPGVREQL